MATLSVQNPTLKDWADTRDPSGKTAATVMLLSQENGVLDYMVYKEGNLPTGEQTNILTGLPTSYYRKINSGVPNSKATRAKVIENAAILESRSEVDADEASLEGDLAAYRMEQAKPFVESMSQKMAETTIYGSAANPEEFVGLANRYNSLSAANAANILSAGGSGSDNTSIWLVGSSQNTVCGIFPKGSKAGLDHQDLGLGDAFDENNNRFRAYMDLWKWKNGLVVKDWRYVVRIPNIDVSDLIGQTGTQASSASTAIIKLMSRSIDRLPSLGGTKNFFMANRTVLSNLRVAALDKSNSAVTIEEGLNQFGQTIHTTKFLGIPVVLVDRILNTEAAVS